MVLPDFMGEPFFGIIEFDLPSTNTIMKYLTLIFLLFMTVAAFGQTPKVTSLHLYVMDCNNQRLKSYWESKDSVTLVQLPEHNTLFEFVPGYQSSFPIQFGYMPISDYELTFTNIFDEKVITKITLEDQAINKVKICPDTLARPLTQNALSKLQEGDSLVIEFNSAGCFHFEDFTLTIVRTKESYLARLYDTYLTEEF